MIAPCLHSADDHLELQIGIVLIQTNLIIRSRIVIVKIHRAPFDVEDSIGRAARYRGKDTATAGEVCAAAQTDIGALILPHREDGEVKWPHVGRWRQTG